MERLHKRIASAGIASRRKAEELIAQGRVQVNGGIVTEMGFKVGPDDEVRVDGKVVRVDRHFYVAMNKPTGVVTTMSDPQGRPTITRYLPDVGALLKPVGRLDMDTEGLLIFTNDGDFANRLAHPRYGVEKEYLAIVEGAPDEKALKRLRQGVFVEGRKTAPADIRVLDHDERKGRSRLRLIIHEGRKRQVRLMCESVGHPVVSLKRVRIGPIRLGAMRKGECRMLAKPEVDTLRKLLKMA